MISSVLKSTAKHQLKGYYTKAMTLSAIKWLAVFGLPLLFLAAESDFFKIDLNSHVYLSCLILIWMVFSTPLAYGSVTFYGHLSRHEQGQINDIFAGFNHYKRCVLTGICLFGLIFLWSLLLIIPGILVAISYSQTWYILRDYDDFTPLEAITLSRLMLRGYKMEYFFLMLTFTGYVLFGIVTAGIAFIFIGPKMETTFANFYQCLKVKQISTIARFIHNCGKY